MLFTSVTKGIVKNNLLNPQQQRQLHFAPRRTASSGSSGGYANHRRRRADAAPRAQQRPVAASAAAAGAPGSSSGSGTSDSSTSSGGATMERAKFMQAVKGFADKVKGAPCRRTAMLAALFPSPGLPRQRPHRSMLNNSAHRANR